MTAVALRLMVDNGCADCGGSGLRGDLLAGPHDAVLAWLTGSA
jgi:hypothetical protein